MNYHLQIAEIIPLTEEEKEKRQSKNNYPMNGMDYVGNYMENNRRAVLDVILTTEQWEKIKLAVLEVKS